MPNRDPKKEIERSGEWAEPRKKKDGTGQPKQDPKQQQRRESLAFGG